MEKSVGAVNSQVHEVLQGRWKANKHNNLTKKYQLKMSNKPGDLERRGKEFQKVKEKSFKKKFPDYFNQ